MTSYKIRVKVEFYEYDKFDYSKEYTAQYGKKQDYDFIATLILTLLKILNVKVVIN